MVYEIFESYESYINQILQLSHELISRDHSFPRQILPNSTAHRGKFLKFRGSPRPPTLESLCRLWPSY